MYCTKELLKDKLEKKKKKKAEMSIEALPVKANKISFLQVR